jgi:hypothetical protein
MTAIIGLLLAPLMLAFLLWMIRPSVRWLNRVLPDSRLKRILFFYWTN